MSTPQLPTLTSAELDAELSRPWTRAEREVWRILEQGLLGYSFRRHALVRGELAGFYCPELGLMLELIEGDPAPETPLARAAREVGLKVARLHPGEVNRPNLVAAIEAVVGRGRLWPED